MSRALTGTRWGYAAVGDDGRRRVVWGIGTTETEAREEAAQWYPDGVVDGLDVEPITAREAETIRMGDVSWPVASQVQS